MSGFPRLLADIGGTNARLAWQASPDQDLQHVQVLQCHEYPTLADAIHHWRCDHHLPHPVSAAMAVASAVQSDLVKFTNSPWSFSIRQLRAELGLAQLVVINDFTALALGLRFVAPRHLRQLGGLAQPQPFQHEAPVALIGAGTGLGVSGLLPDRRGGWTAISGEGGHISLPIHDDQQHQVWSALRSRFGHVSAERVLSGQGLVNIHDSLIHGRTGQWPAQSLTPAQITTLALTQQDALASQVVELFCRWLGAAAGDLALTLGATGGVFIGGGIAPRLADYLPSSGFRRSFEDKGRFAAYLQPLPVWLIDSPISPAMQGAATLLE